MNYQERHWKSKFGVKYTKRNKKIVKNLFIQSVLKKIGKIHNVFEFGTNVGNNLDIIKRFNEKIETNGIEINEFASKIAESKVRFIINGSVKKKIKTKKKFDLVFTSGLLIHISPKDLNKVYKNIFSLTKKYILIAEYFSQEPVAINYRGKRNLLFKRDFAKELKRKFKLKIVDYGFIWSEDKKHNLDNFNWFILKK